MRFTALPLFLAAAGTAFATEPDPLCLAASDRLTRATVAAAMADPIIDQHRTKTPTDDDFRKAAEQQSEQMDPLTCNVILALPESSLQSLARSFVEQMRGDLRASPEP